LGRVSFTNDDGSGRFTQATLVRFDIEETFKGVPTSIRQVWVDPGSFTSCYEDYKLGSRYLIFAGKRRFPSESAAMTVMRNNSGKSKPLPEGFDPSNPPTIYYAPECTGSRLADGLPSLDQDLAMLRAYRAGTPLPRIIGHVYLYPFGRWPVLSGPRLQDAHVTMTSDAARLQATTDANGNFSLSDAPAGYYNAWADLPPYRMDGQVILHVPETGCGYVDIQLATTSTLQGIVLDVKGRPVPKVPVQAELKGRDSEEAVNGSTLRATTDQNGQFSITGLPDADLYLSAGNEFPTIDMPYRRVYHPKGHDLKSAAVLRLKPGEHPLPIVLLLEEPLVPLTINVRVVHQGGESAPNAAVNAFGSDDVIAESAKTDTRGAARIACLRGLKYELEAQTLPTRLPWTGDIRKSPRSVFTCGDRDTAFTLVLDHSARY
jgi:hypothetical protein